MELSFKMALLRIFALTAAISGVLLLLSTSGTEAVIVELGKVKCILVVKFNEVFEKAHHDCWIKLQEELKGKEHEEQKQFPYNATIEEFEWDDHCLGQCIYKTAGIVSFQGCATILFLNNKLTKNLIKFLMTVVW